MMVVNVGRRTPNDGSSLRKICHKWKIEWTFLRLSKWLVDNCRHPFPVPVQKSRAKSGMCEKCEHLNQATNETVIVLRSSRETTSSGSLNLLILKFIGNGPATVTTPNKPATHCLANDGLLHGLAGRHTGQPTDGQRMNAQKVRTALTWVSPCHATPFYGCHSCFYCRVRHSFCSQLQIGKSNKMLAIQPTH